MVSRYAMQMQCISFIRLHYVDEFTLCLSSFMKPIFLQRIRPFNDDQSLNIALDLFWSFYISGACSSRSGVSITVLVFYMQYSQDTRRLRRVSQRLNHQMFLWYQFQIHRYNGHREVSLIYINVSIVQHNQLLHTVYASVHLQCSCASFRM